MTLQLPDTMGATEMIHGVEVPDPYRWLEDRGSASSRRWLGAQRQSFEEYFERLGPLDHLRSRVREFLNVDSVDQVCKIGERYFYRKRSVGKQQSSIFVRSATNSSERLLIDPSSLGQYATVGIHHIAPDGKLLAYELKSGGEHSKAIHIVDVNSGDILSDHLDRGLSRGFTFDRNRSGFYYCHDLVTASEPRAHSHQIRFHRFGTSADEDRTLFSMPRAKGTKLVLRSSEEMLGALLCWQEGGAPVVDLYCATRSQPEKWTPVFKRAPAPIGPFFYRDRLFAQYYEHAQNGEIVELDPTSGRRGSVVVPEWSAPIRQFTIAAGRFYINYAVGTDNVVRVWSLSGEHMGTLPLEVGHSWDLFLAHSNDEDEVFLRGESFTKPPTVYSYDVRTSQLKVWAQIPSIESTVSATVKKIVYCSSDGTEVSMSLIGAENQLSRRTRPVLMTAYGGFGVPMVPQFSVLITVMLELGFVCAVPEIRGGGEKGFQWAEAARSRNRQVGFDDFISAATWLCENGISSPGELCLLGACNGGLLVGAVVTQRPSLFRAALCIAPLLDMVRYEQFDNAQVWSHEYGKADNPDDFRALYRYSPYHHVALGTNYPAMLFVTGDKDTRANPAHALKMAAQLQGRPAQTYPILLDYSEERGHSPSMPTDVRIEQIVRRVAFLCNEIGLPWAQGGLNEPTTRR